MVDFYGKCRVNIESDPTHGSLKIQRSSLYSSRIDASKNPHVILGLVGNQGNPGCGRKDIPTRIHSALRVLVICLGKRGKYLWHN